LTLKIFIQNLLEPIYFVISIFLSKKFYKKNYQKFKRKIKNKHIYILGAGPSLNTIKIKKIYNSTIILINGTYELYNKFDKSNKIFWSSCDVQRIHDLMPLLPKKLDCITSSSKYRGVTDLVSSKNQILYFHPKLSIVKKNLNFMSIFKIKIPILCPKTLFFSKKKSKYKISDLLKENNIIIPRGTSILPLLLILMKMSPKTINLFGMDMGDNKRNDYANLKFYKNVKTGITKRDKESSKIFLNKILEKLKKNKIRFINHSAFKLD
jgi:hypothetical protein